MHLESVLKSINKKTIDKSELGSLFGVYSDAELYSLISDAESAGLLSAVKASGTNGSKTYPIYLKYRITIAEDYSNAISEIAMLHPLITKNGYLSSKPQLYLKYREQINDLNRFLFRKEICVNISKKERSFEIFGEEKQLDVSSFISLLDRLGLTHESLGYYETPEYCFNDYIPTRKQHLTLLICENKDIWFNIRRRMYEDRAAQIFDTPIDGVVYGCGNKVSEKDALSEYTRFLGSEKVLYLYWGDIDRAGLNIYLSVKKNNPDLDINLFVPAYSEMLCLADKRRIPDSEDHRSISTDYTGIYSLFSDDEKNRLESFILLGKRIPQEIISYEILLKVMR